MLTWLVGQCHVSATNREVIRHVISKLKKGYQTWRTIPVARRKEMMRSIIKAHRDNRELYPICHERRRNQEVNTTTVSGQRGLKQRWPAGVRAPTGQYAHRVTLEGNTR